MWYCSISAFQRFSISPALAIKRLADREKGCSRHSSLLCWNGEMANTINMPRSHVILGLSLPLAVLIGYSLAEPMDLSSIAVVLGVALNGSEASVSTQREAAPVDAELSPE